MNDKLDIFKIKTNNVKPEKGKILIAEPFLAGDYFNRSVVLLVNHGPQGTVGFVLNKPVDIEIHEAFQQFPPFETLLYLGGPVATDSVYFIHTLGEKIEGSIPILKNLYWGGDFELIKQEIEQGNILPHQIRFFLGYSGWDGGQLEREIQEDSWLVADIEPEEVMQDLDESSWSDFVEKAGKRYSIWKNFPEHPSLN